MRKKILLVGLLFSVNLHADLLIENFGEIETQAQDVSIKKDDTRKPFISPEESQSQDDKISKLELLTKQETIKQVPLPTPVPRVTTKEKPSEYEEFTLSEDGDNSGAIAGEDDSEIGGDSTTTFTKIDKKIYSKVKYNYSMNKYVVINPGKNNQNGKKEFKKYLENNEIDEFMFKRFKDSDASIESILTSALYYDWFLARPDYAENFYKLLFKRKKELSLQTKYYLSEYLIRTDRGHLIHKVIEKKECSIIFKGRDDCFYYLGLDKFLNNGDRSNNFLRLAKGKSELAKKLFKYKK